MRFAACLFILSAAVATQPILIHLGGMVTGGPHLPRHHLPPQPAYCQWPLKKKAYLEHVKKLVLPISAPRIFNALHS